LVRPAVVIAVGSLLLVTLVVRLLASSGNAVDTAGSSAAARNATDQSPPAAVARSDVPPFVERRRARLEAEFQESLTGDVGCRRSEFEAELRRRITNVHTPDGGAADLVAVSCSCKLCRVDLRIVRGDEKEVVARLIGPDGSSGDFYGR
jgi:hypothetical protein